MTTYDTLIKKSKVLLNTSFEDVALLINDGVIQKIAKSDLNIRADNVISPKNQVLLPGRIDLHVHFRDPGYTHKEDFYSGSASAIAGGTTFVIDMPNTNPPTATPTSYQEKLEIAQKKSVVDFSLAYALTNETVEHISEIKPDILKAYFRKTNGLSIDLHHFSKFYDPKKTICIHAEDETLIERDSTLAEISSVQSIRESGNKTPLHFCHMTTKAAIECVHTIESATLETCPHYLFFSEEDNTSSLYKVNPSLKSKQEVKNLWNLLISDKISAIATDHAPHTLDEKNSDTPPSGIPGVETCLPLLFTKVYENVLPLYIFAKTLFLRPAQIAKIHPKKGIIDVGSDADIVFTKKGEYKIKADDLHTKCPYTPYENMVSKVKVETTMLRGTIVFEDNQIRVNRGFGKNIV